MQRLNRVEEWEEFKLAKKIISGWRNCMTQSTEVGRKDACRETDEINLTGIVCADCWILKNKPESKANNNKQEINKHLEVTEMKSELSNGNNILP